GLRFRSLVDSMVVPIGPSIRLRGKHLQSLLHATGASLGFLGQADGVRVFLFVGIAELLPLRFGGAVFGESNRKRRRRLNGSRRSIRRNGYTDDVSLLQADGFAMFSAHRQIILAAVHRDRRPVAVAIDGNPDRWPGFAEFLLHVERDFEEQRVSLSPEPGAKLLDRHRSTSYRVELR